MDERNGEANGEISMHICARGGNGWVNRERGEGKEEDTTKRDNEREGRRERPHSAGSSRIDVLRENKRETIIIFCKTHT